LKAKYTVFLTLDLLKC